MYLDLASYIEIVFMYVHVHVHIRIRIRDVDVDMIVCMSLHARELRHAHELGKEKNVEL